MQSILKQVLAEIIPKKETIPEIEEFIKKIKGRIEKQKIKAKVEKGGSYAKGTFLKDDFDIDLFILFDKKYPNESLSDLLESLLKPFRPKRVHGSRDYFQIKKGKYSFEIIPVYDIKTTKQAINITDCSPLHVHWVKEHDKKYKNEIRLAKKFCKAQKVYGAESYLQGFSGHVLDILIIKFKGFIPLLKQSLNWKPKTVVDIKNIHKGKALEKLNTAKIQSPLIVIDPVEPERNAAAALSKEKFSNFIKAAEEFLKNPSKAFFIEKKLSIRDIKKQFSNAIILKLYPLKGKSDIIGSKLRQSVLFCKKGLQEFNIEAYGWEWDKKSPALAFFVVKKKELEPEEIIKGPLLRQKKHVKAFKSKHANTFEEKSRIWAKEKRRFRTPKQKLKEIIKQEYLKQRVKKVMII